MENKNIKRIQKYKINFIQYMSNSKHIRFALVDAEGKPVQLSDNTVIATISCPYTDMLIPCDENTGEFDCYIIKEKNKLVAKPKKDSDGNANKYFEVKINGKTAFYSSLDSAIKDINAIKKLPTSFFKTLQMTFLTEEHGDDFCIRNIEFGKIKVKG